MKQTTASPLLKEAEKAIDKIKKIIPKLSDGEKATLELLLDEKAMKGLEESMKDIREGRTYTLDEVRKMF